MSRWLALGLTPLLLVTGCVYKSRVGKEPITPPPTFLHAGAAAKAPPVGRFWEAFGDPVLNRLVEQALTGSLELERAQARIDQARASLLLAGAGHYPQVTAQAEASRSSMAFQFPNPVTGETQKTTMTRSSYSVSLAASYEVDLWGKVRFAAKAARGQLQAAQEDHRAAQVSVVAQLVDAYFLAVELRAQLILTDQTITSREAHLEVVQQRYRNGVVTALDVYQAEENLARVRAQRPALVQRLSVTEHAIAVLVGGAPSSAVAGAAEQLPEKLAALPVGVPGQLLLQRPDVRAAHARLVAADASVGQAVAAHYPTVSISGSIGSSFDPTAFLWSLLGGITAPLFQGRRIEAEVKRNEGVLREVLAGYRATVLVAVREVEDALVAGQTVAQRLRHLTGRVASAEGALRMAHDQYVQGLVPYLTVLTSEQSVYAARSDLISAQRELISAHVQLARALGGGWMKQEAGNGT